MSDGSDVRRVAVIGATGAMGRAACAAIEAADDLELVARIGRGDSLDALTEAGATVAVDLTSLDSVLANIDGCLQRGVHVVVGTSGFDADRLATVRAQLAAAAERGLADLGVLVVPNFSVGALLMMRFAAEAAPYFESVEVIELHRATKADAPSGTARHTAEVVAAARREAGIGPAYDATRSADGGAPEGVLDGVRGAAIDGIPVHSIRLRGLLAHQEVLLGNEGEVLTIRHDSMDRASFMPGVLLALRAVPGHPGLTVGLDAILWPS